ncbi:MAG: Trk family potassium uptake protein [Planctomycetes bacterium B3_Pla]|nr:MAG: Trk family potassium uptake protein [Planctomycetes bacterium B3_Pla]
MQIQYKNKRLERVLIGVNALIAAVVVASFVLLFGFDVNDPPIPAWILYSVQAVLLCAFVAEKIVRLFNSVSKAEFWRANRFEIPLLLGLAIAVLGAGRWFSPSGTEAAVVRHLAVGVYLAVQVVAKLCRTSVNLAASGQNTTRTLVASFLVLIISGAGLLMLPKASAENTESLSLVDALFTATSATCVTGLIVKDTQNFSLMGQVVILMLIQLGGLGIVVFGAVFALLLGQALSVRERVAMQDLLSARTLSRIGNMITFIIIGTILIEAVGAISLFGMWDGDIKRKWFYCVFHSISAFCNAGFSLYSRSFEDYDRSWQVYVVICPLIILGGLGFSVLYDLINIAVDRIKRFFKKWFNKRYRFSMEAPKRMRLQTKIVLSVSASLIVLGMLAILLFERYASPGDSAAKTDVLGALFQSITARTAGFNTVDVSAMSPSSRFVLILLMFIGGSPGSTAGGIKTVTLAVVIMIAVAALRKRQEVEMFKRSVRVVVVGRAITVTLLFVAVLFCATLALSISENSNGFAISDIAFEAASALGTVGLTTGVTPFLTTAGKLIIITAMLIGRLGPLTLLAALTFNLRPARYNYPDEAIIVG